jgi:signal transduction histidine kinase
MVWPASSSSILCTVSPCVSTTSAWGPQRAAGRSSSFSRRRRGVVPVYAELAERENWLQDLIRKLITAQEEEHRKVSYEVHNGLAQTVAGAHQLLQTFARQHPPDSDKGRKDLARVLELVQQKVGEARYVIADLRPTALDDLGLGPAVRLQIEKISSEGSQVDYEEAPERSVCRPRSRRRFSGSHRRLSPTSTSMLPPPV